MPVPTLDGNGEPYEGKLYTVDSNGECGADVPHKSAILFDGTQYFLVKKDCADIEPVAIAAEEIQILTDIDALVYQGDTYEPSETENYTPVAVTFSAADRTYLSRTPAQAGNQQVWTLSVWVRRTAFGNKDVVFSTSNKNFQLFFDADGDANRLRASENGGDSFDLKTQVRYTDAGQWLHIVLSVDTTQATAAERAKLYVNGERITALASAKYPALNKLFDINGTGIHNIGRRSNGDDRYFKGEMSEFFLLDGIAADASAFGQYSSSGQWVYKPYGGAYGPNGFYLRFNPPGEDHSGNQNHFTPFNF